VRSLLDPDRHGTARHDMARHKTAGTRMATGRRSPKSILRIGSCRRWKCRDAELAWCAEGFARRRVLAICGLAGIGKTSLLLTAAHAQARRVSGTVAYHSCAEGDRISGVLASLLSGAHPVPSRVTPLRAALDEVVAWAARTPLVLCIDDSHRMSDPLLLDVLSHLGAAAAPIWLALASRLQVPLPEVDIDGEILRLGPLSVESARALWHDLEQRFGPSVLRFDLVDAARVQSRSPCGRRSQRVTWETMTALR
jgi:RecA/RadA recombinase